MSNAPSRVLHITHISGNDMAMKVKYSLTSGFSAVHTNVVPIRFMLFFNKFLGHIYG